MNIEPVQSFEISEEDLTQFKRLDTFLASKISELSRTLIKKQFELGHISGTTQLILKKMPPIGTIVTVKLPPPLPVDIEPQDIPLDILFEDEHLIIVNKQAGLVVHPAPGNYDGTLVNAILFHCPNLKGIGNEKRPGIVHRLDKGTSGIMVVAKDHQTHEGLVKLFSSHNITRKYEAITLGAKLPETKTLESMIGRNQNNRLKMSTNVKNGKIAITHLRTLEYFQKLSHVELTLETGRTHQIRVHLSELLRCPILNDSAYGRIKEQKVMLSSMAKAIIKDYEHPFLHAKHLGFTHPITKQELVFDIQPPQIFQDILAQLKRELDARTQ